MTPMNRDFHCANFAVNYISLPSKQTILGFFMWSKNCFHSIYIFHNLWLEKILSKQIHITVPPKSVREAPALMKLKEEIEKLKSQLTKLRSLENCGIPAMTFCEWASFFSNCIFTKIQMRQTFKCQSVSFISDEFVNSLVSERNSNFWCILTIGVLHWSTQYSTAPHSTSQLSYLCC